LSGFSRALSSSSTACRTFPRLKLGMSVGFGLDAGRLLRAATVVQQIEQDADGIASHTEEGDTIRISAPGVQRDRNESCMKKAKRSIRGKELRREYKRSDFPRGLCVEIRLPLTSGVKHCSSRSGDRQRVSNKRSSYQVSALTKGARNARASKALVMVGAAFARLAESWLRLVPVFTL